MRFPAYLAAKNETQRAFSMRSGVPYRTVNRAALGEPVGGKSAVRISAACRAQPTSDGEFVTERELLEPSREAA